MGHDRARWGSVTFVQRFGSSLNLNPHVHVLMLDGVYVDGEDAPVFVPAPAPSPTLPRGPGAPGPGPRAHRGGQAGCRAVGGGRRCERCVLRPSAALGDPAGAGVFRRPQRMRGLWRAPEDHRRPDRSGLDPMLFDRGRFAGPAPGVGPLPGPRRSRRSSSPPDLPSRPVAVAGRTAGGCPQRSLRPRIDADTGRQATKLYCELGRRTGNDPQGSCQTLAVRSAP